MRAVGIGSGRAAWGRVEHGGVERVFRVLAPRSPGPRATLPALVVVLHGGLGLPRGIALMTGFDAAAAREGFVAAYPAGLGRTWNAGACCGQAARDGVDDVGFVSELIGRLVDNLACDPARVFATGISNGGMLAYRLAAQRPDLVAAIAPVAAAMLPPAEPREPVSVLAIHGTRDLNAPYDGGVGPKSLSGVSYPPVRSVIERWVEACGCGPTPSVERAGVVTSETWTGGRTGADVRLITIDGGGHSWPGGRQLAAVWDPPSPALDATSEIWRFFAAHPRPIG
jgi:polyhydroxybutyrate depolymerase